MWCPSHIQRRVGPPSCSGSCRSRSRTTTRSMSWPVNTAPVFTHKRSCRLPPSSLSPICLTRSACLPCRVSRWPPERPSCCVCPMALSFRASAWAGPHLPRSTLRRGRSKFRPKLRPIWDGRRWTLLLPNWVWLGCLRCKTEPATTCAFGRSILSACAEHGAREPCRWWAKQRLRQTFHGCAWTASA